MGPARSYSLESLFVSTLVVAIAEIGDKTQLLALLLASKFRKPVAIILGILAATLANHAGAAALGTWVAALVGPDMMRWLLGGSFIAMGLWTLIPDKIEDDEDTATNRSRLGVFGTTVITFFLLEMGDKTQIATIALAAKYSNLVAVTTGTTLGMMLANVPAVLVGDIAAKKLPLSLVRAVTAAIFVVLGIVTLLDVLPHFR